MPLSNKRKAELSEIVDSQICCAELTNWDSVDDFEEEIVSGIESTEDVTEEDLVFCSELIADYWNENGGNDDQDEDCE